MFSRIPWARLLVVLAVVSSVLAPSAPSVAQEAQPVSGGVPEGFGDGIPVGSDDVPPLPADDQYDAYDQYDTVDSGFRTSSETIKRPITRYFGAGAYAALVTAAASTTSSCSVSRHGLLALILAPVFGESSAATTPSSAPSPMTLSRADEWTTGVRNGETNTNANYGLYAFENPSTPYARAYWHPGIGIWQYDSAGLGARYIAPELMNPNVIGRDVAKGMLDRYCNNIGKGAESARLAAWSPWAACHPAKGQPSRCEDWFHDLYLNRDGAPSGSHSGFSTLELVPGIYRLGGTQARRCTVGGGSPRPCWYVDPARAQGSKGWTGTPDDGDPSSRPAPLSHPFYVYKRNGREHRVWLAEDTGYRIDIWAYRELGKNARPRSNQPGSGLTWRRTTTLCDVTADRGRCTPGSKPPPPPPPPQSTADPTVPSGLRIGFHTVNGTTYRPLIGDFDGDGLSDVLFYAPGATQDYVWWSRPDGSFSSTAVSVGGDYETHVGDIDGNGTDDVVWYNGSNSYVWLGRTNRRFTSLPVSLPSNRTVFLADIGGNGAKNVVSYGPGPASDRILTWAGNRFTSRSITVNGTFTPVVGNFDGTGGDDILWYAPGPATDYVWWTSGSSISTTVVTVNGTYDPIVGDFDGDGRDDVMWYGVGAMPDYTWFGGAARRFSSRYTPVTGDYVPIVADLGGDGRDDIVWYAPGPGTDYWWRYGSGRRHTSSVLSLRGHYRAGSGVFGSGRDGIFWYGPGAGTDALWYA